MRIGKPDKRTDGVGPSPSLSPLRHRGSSDARSWKDADLFGNMEGEATSDREAADSRPTNGKSQDITGQKERRLSSFSLSGNSEGPGPEEAVAPEPVPPRAQRQRRQPPLSASSFLLDADGRPNDGLLSLYCSINYSRDGLHKFKFLDRLEAREARKEEYKKELQAAQALLAMKTPNREQSTRPWDEEPDLSRRRQVQQEALRASVTVKSKMRQLARLAAEERADLRDDLNTLLSEMREGLIACYPYNEHLSRLSRRLDKFSTQPELWAKYRPRLVQLHTTGFLKKWEDAGCPSQPHKLLQPGQPVSPPEAEEHPNAKAQSAEYMEEDLYAHEATWEVDKPFSGPQDVQRGTELHADGGGKTAAAAQHKSHPECQSEGPTAEQLEELRLKQLEARARREKLRAAQHVQQ